MLFRLNRYRSFGLESRGSIPMGMALTILEWLAISIAHL
jgi:hypothetical protein